LAIPEVSMLKRLITAASILAALTGHVQAAGTIPGISMSQQLDTLGAPLNGGKLYLIQAGTTATPQNCYQDSGLTLAWPNPITLDSAGRVPQLFCADGSIKVRITTSTGISQLVADNLLIVGPSGGGGGGGSVDPTTILQTGHMEVFYGTGTMSGFVRCNGRTIGSASSGATERANADAQALFEYLWGADSNLSVSTGRGASAAADYAANKTITLPDCRGRTLAGLDDMGSTAASRLTATYFGAAATTLGAVGGTESHALTSVSQFPPYTPAGSITNGAITTNVTSGSFLQSSGVVQVGSGGSFFSYISVSPTATSTQATSIFNGGLVGSSAPFATAMPAILATIYLKL
jgi:hypothetical protein